MKTIHTILIFLLVFYSHSVIAQDKIEITKTGFSIQITFDEAYFKDIQNGILTIRDYQEFTDVSKAGKFKLPSQMYLIVIPPNSKPNISFTVNETEKTNNIIPALHPEAKLLNDSTIIYEQVDYSKAIIERDVNKNLEVVGFVWYQGNYCAQVKISTHSFNSAINEINRIKVGNVIVDFGNSFSFSDVYDLKDSKNNDQENANDLILNPAMAKQFAAEQSLELEDTTGNWINYGSEYLKIGTAKDALFRIYKLDLEAKGINTSLINPKTFRLFESGVEISITVFGEDDNVFDENDYIQFYGTLNYPEISHRIINNPDEPYNEYLDRYSDTTFYFITWNQQNGLRIPSQNGFVSGLNDSLTYYNFVEHTESNRLFQNFYTDEVENQSPGWLRNKTWYYLQTAWLYSNTTRNYNFTVTDPVPDKSAKFFYKAVSGGSNITNNAHQVILKVNEVLLDSQSIGRNEQLLLAGSLNTNSLNIGTNVLLVKNYANGTNPNYLGVDWYDIEYPKYLDIGNDFVMFNVGDDVIDGLKVIKMKNAISSEYEIYKVKPYLKKINNYQVISNELFFTDTIRIGDAYIVSAPVQINNPIFYYKKQFLNLRSLSSQADYLAITHPKFFQSAQNYVNVVSSMYNVTSSLISVEDIFDEFGFGYPTPESIRLFNSVTYQNRVLAKPEYLVLIGDANYDYKLYRFKADGVIGGGNYVPSFGNPISDNWLAIWDETALPLPQLKVGRIPVNTNEEIDYYLSKVQNNFNSQFDKWNKKSIFFSGGRANQPGEIDQLKAVNDQIINNFVQPAPLSGSYKHFYKTTDPLTDFGPYTSEEFNKTIDDGGVFISYIGHSGTATWDNSISEPTQLKNEVNRNPLITDFGCSTNKFAEPDIVCFGERFLLNNEGQAIGYIGNSSLGFTSSSLNVSIYFYEEITNGISKEVGAAHQNSKIRMFQNLGTSDVFKLFSLTNTLIGDPIIKLKLPDKPNLKISEQDIIFNDRTILDNQDTILLKIVLNNFGLKSSSQFDYIINHFYQGTLQKTYSGRNELPAYQDTIEIWLHTFRLAGENSVIINLDINNEIEEINENDNALSLNFYVYSTELRDIIKHRFENSFQNNITILNPTLMDEQEFQVTYQISDNESFNSFNENTVPADSFYTILEFPQLQQNKRYFFRYRLSNSNSVYSSPKSFYNIEGYDFQLIDSVSFNKQDLDEVKYENDKVKIFPKNDVISVTSAGFEAGATCVIAKNGINLLSNTFFAGMGIVVFNDLTLEVDTSAWFQLFNQPGNMAQLVAMIDSIPIGKIVAMGVSSDAANNITPALKQSIKTLGSALIDSLAFRSSWALIGKKGAVSGEALEELRGRYEGLIYLDSTFTSSRFKGTIKSVEIGPATNWQSATVLQNIPNGSTIQHFAYGIKTDESVDSLGALNFVNNSASLGFINPKTYPKIKIISEFYATPEGVSPELSSLGVDYVGLPELGTNFQVVGVDNDTIPVGGNIALTFWVYNVGEANADSFSVKVDIVNQNNSSSTILYQVVTSLPSNSKIKYEVNYRALDTDREKRFLINIDSENKVTEYFEDNNFFTKTFYIQPDVISPSLKITFDEMEVLSGDFVSKNPNIKIALSDESPIPIVDTTAVKIYLNEEPVYYGANSSILSYTINSNNPKFVAEYKPDLEDGEYLLRVVGKDPNGNTADSASSEVYFVVSSETKPMQVYNYPNPFSNETYFTFRLSQIPEEVKIRIYTIAGRMIKEIVRKSSELNYDLNKIYWDGKDADGDIVANGTYLYKFLIKHNDKVESITQKLVIIK